LNNLIQLFKKDFIRFFNDQPAVLLTFIVPVVLIVIFGSIFGGGGSRGKVPVIFINESDSEIATLIEEKLDSSSSIRLVKKYEPEDSDSSIFFTEGIAKEYVKTGKISAAVVLPEDFLSDTSLTMTIKYYYDPKNEIESAIIQAAIQKTVFSQLPEIFPALLTRQANDFLGAEKGDEFRESMANVVSDYFGVEKDSILKFTSQEINQNMFGTNDDSSSTSFMENLIKFDSEQLVGTELKNPGVTRIVGGWAMMFLLFSLTGAATSLFEEKQEGTLRRLLCMPVKRSQVLMSKYLYSMTLGIVQLLVMFLFAWALFDVDSLQQQQFLSG